MSKHTPGPWIESQGCIVCKGGYTVGTVNSHNTTEGKSNARLIATTPELLEALMAAEARDEEIQIFAEVERLYKSAGTDIKSGFDYEYYRRLKQRSVIARATGNTV